MRYIKPWMAFAVLATISVGAQTVPTIEPGMSQAQVVERLGQPMGVRTYGSFTYLFHRNGCEKRCGMNDLVVLDSDKVVDAVFRSSARKYSGDSSSPRAIPASEARHSTTGGQLNTPPKKPEGDDQTSQRKAQP
jgi:outer membrane protein assembly factor BamE (lipoprotein component of BamABCDE complex)